MVAGVMVPPKPEEPDNCCMSGCVNCVWDRFRDEMEEWAVANAEAERRLAAQEKQQQQQQQPGGPEPGLPPPPPAAGAEVVAGPRGAGAPATSISDRTALSMDDDGGGSETNWGGGPAATQDPEQMAKDLWDEDLYKNVPVGIREFMKQEKKLKEKHMREGSSGG